MPPASELLTANSLAPEASSILPQIEHISSGCHSKQHYSRENSRSSSAMSPLDVSFSFESEGRSSPEAEARGATVGSGAVQPLSSATCQPPRRPSSWHVEASELSLNTVNPIRKITDAAGPASLSSSDAANPRKSTISLGQGDPTVFGHLAVPQEAANAVAEALASSSFNGYTPSFGLPQSRDALAQFLTSVNGPEAPITPADVYVTSGCGHSFQLCLEALSNPGKNVLVPRPGFPVYDCWCAAAGLEIRRYSLLPEQNWEVDLGEVRELADENTVAILLCNPGNPCGNVFTANHIEEVLLVAQELKVPVISDEIYGGITFGESTFATTASIAGSLRVRSTPAHAREDGNGNEESRRGEAEFSVPVLTVSSISKTLLVPGWRLGWIAVHDPAGILKAGKVIQALENRMQFTTPSCALVQAALPSILGTLTHSYFAGLNSTLESALQLSLARIASIPGLDCPSQPQGGMFLMVRVNLARFPDFGSDMEWCRALLAEESVVVIPGTAFEFPGWFRTLISAPEDILEEAWSRIEDFSVAHVKQE